MFKQRASFDQSYDEGRFGRFGRHILGADMALDLPFGIGPLQFHNYFPEDTHNSYLNAFMSGGWISGICYPALVFVTALTGFRYIFVRAPWQRTYLAIFSAYLGTVGESFIIDTDHWRHFWMMLGAMWGMYVAAERWKAECRSGNREGFLAPLALTFAWLPRPVLCGNSDHRLELLSCRQHGLVALRHETQHQLEFGVRIGLPQLQHAALQVLIEPPNLGNVLRHDRNEYLAAVLLVALTAHKARLLQPVDHAGNGAGRQSRQFGKPAGGHPALNVEEVEAFEIGTRNPDPAGDGLSENHAQRGGSPHRVFQILQQRSPRFRS